MANTTLARKLKYQPVDGLDRFNRIRPATNVVFNLIFIAVSLFCVVPVLFVVSISFSSESSIVNYGYQLIPHEFSAEGYVYLARQGTMLVRALGVSLVVTIGGTALGVLLTTLMGYVISRPNYYLKKALTWVVFIPMVFNGGLVATYFINSRLLHLTDTLWALILPLAVSSFNVIVCKTFFRTNVPESLIEAGKIDGASQFTIFFRIVLPISLPVLATIGLFLCFAYWNDWYNSLLFISKDECKSLQYFLQEILNSIQAMKNLVNSGVDVSSMSQNLPQETLKMAMTIITTGPIILLYPFIQRYFVKGLTIGAVKG